MAALWNPLLEPGDTVQVRTPVGVLESHVVDRVEYRIPLGEMVLATRVLDAV